jgi:K(+)-stimulated pyrophosphate-energized sodium pump
MQEIAAAVREGAQAYLNRQYTTIGIVGVVIFFILGWLLGWLVALGFLIGAVLSGATGYIGMNVSVRANVRTAQAAIGSLAGGLELAFKAGASPGYWSPAWRCSASPLYFALLIGPLKYAASDRTVIDALVALGFGASLISIFARLGGGISPRAPTSAATWSARSRPVFRRMIRAIPPPSPTTSAITWATAPAWRPTCSNLRGDHCGDHGAGGDLLRRHTAATCP